MMPRRGPRDQVEGFVQRQPVKLLCRFHQDDGWNDAADTVAVDRKNKKRCHLPLHTGLSGYGEYELQP